MTGGAAGLFDAAIGGGGGATHATFAEAGDGWRFVRSSTSCGMSGDRVSCR